MLLKVVAAAAAAICLASSACAGTPNVALKPRQVAAALLNMGLAVALGGNPDKECWALGLGSADCSELVDYIKLSTTAAAGHPALLRAIQMAERRAGRWLFDRHGLNRAMAASPKAIRQLVAKIRPGPEQIARFKQYRQGLLSGVCKRLPRLAKRSGLRDYGTGPSNDAFDVEVVVVPSAQEPSSSEELRDEPVFSDVEVVVVPAAQEPSSSEELRDEPIISNTEASVGSRGSPTNESAELKWAFDAMLADIFAVVEHPDDTHELAMLDAEEARSRFKEFMLRHPWGPGLKRVAIDHEATTSAIVRREFRQSRNHVRRTSLAVKLVSGIRVLIAVVGVVLAIGAIVLATVSQGNFAIALGLSTPVAIGAWLVCGVVERHLSQSQERRSHIVAPRTQMEAQLSVRGRR